MSIPGLFLLLHPILREIPQEQILAVLSPEEREAPREVFVVQPFTGDLSKLDDHDLRAAARMQREQFESQIEPRLREKEGWQIVYAGLAPLTLAAHLGALVGSMRKVKIVQQHHATFRWDWQESAARPGWKIEEEGLPKDRSMSSAPAAIRVSTSYKIEEAMPLEIHATPSAHVHLSTPHITPDSFASEAELKVFQERFRFALNTIYEQRPNMTEIHVFASVPVGAAFAIGQVVSPTAHRHVFVHQYKAQRTPAYYDSVPLHSVSASPTPVDERLSHEMLSLWREELKELRTHAHNDRGRRGETWLQKLGLLEYGLPDSAEAFEGLESAAQTVLLSSNALELGESGRFRDSGGNWTLPASLLSTIGQQVRDLAKRRQAARMFFLHEAVHTGVQGLTPATGRRAGDIARVVEEIDYRADVWAFLQELSYASHRDADVRAHMRQYVAESIQTAMQVMWAFDRDRESPSELEQRRVYRYITWAWMILRLRAAQSDGAAFKALLSRPVLDLAGLPLVVRRGADGRERVCVQLRPVDGLELAVLEGNIFRRWGDGHAVQLRDLVDAMRAGDTARIVQCLEGAGDQLPLRQAG